MDFQVEYGEVPGVHVLPEDGQGQLRVGVHVDVTGNLEVLGKTHGVVDDFALAVDVLVAELE